jgi:hypothetical protein
MKTLSRVILASLSLLPLRMVAAPPMHLKWEQLSIVTGKNVSIAQAGGTVIVGKAAAVESDALVVLVKGKSTVRVPRANLHRFEIQTKGKGFRILGTSLGTCAGFVGGALAAWGIQGGLFGNKNQGAAGAAFFGIWGGATVGGYFVGNAADKHWTPVEIID